MKAQEKNHTPNRRQLHLAKINPKGRNKTESKTRISYTIKLGSDRSPKEKRTSKCAIHSK